MDGRKRGKFGVFFLILSLAVASCQAVDPDTPFEPSGASGARRYLVRIKDPWASGSDTAAQSARLSAIKTGSEALIRASMGPEAEIQQVYGTLYAVQVPQGQDVNTALDKLRATGEVEHIEEDVQVAHFGDAPNDPGFSQQWAHAVVDSVKAWGITTGSSKIVVAIVDTGMDYTHPDLAANVWTNPGEIAGNGQDDDHDGYVDDVHGFDFANNDSDPMADDAPHYHGTHVSGTIGAIGNNGIGVIGHSPVVTLMPLKFLDSSGSGYVSNAIRAIDFAIAHGARIISNSWGGSQGSTELQAAIQRARSAGILFVVAAGNGGSDGIGDNNDVVPTFPAAYNLDNMIAVAATDQNDQLTRFSNYGPTTVAIGAPGLNIYSTMNGSSYQTMSGTSMATPLVSGVAALLMAKRPDLPYTEIKRAILENADPVPALSGRVTSNGRINAYRALAALPDGGGGNPTPPPPPPPTDPTPPPSNPTPPANGIARQPLVAGQTHLVDPVPYVQIPIDYDVSEFQGAYGAYVEVSRPGTAFSNPNGNAPDPQRLTFAYGVGARNRLFLTPAQILPGWGVYGIRVIPLSQQGQPLGLFSNPSILELRPQ